MQDTKERSFKIIFAVAYLAYSAIYIARLNFSVASALLESAGLLDKTQIGLIGSVFSFSFAISKVPNGYLGDRFPAKRIIVCGLLITSVSNLLIGLYPRFWSIVILWGLNAYGQSMLWGPLLRSFSSTYSGERFKRISQLLVSSVATGSILGLLLATWCATAFGAAACFLIPSGVALLMALLIQCLFLDVPGQQPEERPSLASALKTIWRNTKFRQMIVPTMSHGMIKDNINVWLTVYFVDTYGIDITTIASYIFFIPAFAFVGRLLYPVLYHILKNDYYVSSFSFGLCILAVVILCVDGIPVQLAIICLGTISALVAIINTHILSIFPTEISDSGHLSLAASSMDLLTYGGAGIGSVFFGVLIQNFGYECMFGIWGAACGISILFLLYVCRHQKNSSPSGEDRGESKIAF